MAQSTSHPSDREHQRGPALVTGILPPRLRPGDTVAVCSLASPVQRERLNRGVKALSERYRIRVSDGVLAARGYLAGTDELRANELNKLLRDPDVRAIIPAHGGYGITRITHHLDAEALRADPKIIVGYSEGTALLCWALAAAGVRGVHGPMVATFGERAAAQQQHMLDLLEGKELPGPFPFANGDASATGRREGRLLGGNLTLLSFLVGTPFQISFEEALLFMEDTSKRPYAIDRRLTHLHSAGVFAGVKAAVLGELWHCTKKSPDEPGPTAEEVVFERMASFGIPLVSGLPVGHGDDNLALPFGGQASLDFDHRELTLLEGAVA